MAAYRLYLFNEKLHIKRAEDYDLPDDDAATMKARERLRQTGDVRLVEVWERERLVSRVAR